MAGETPDFGAIEYGAEIGARIRNLRKNKGLTLEKLSEELKSVGLDMNFPVISKIETGKRKDLTLREIDAIAYVLGVSVQKLWTQLSRDKR
jgi:transcriptional regulator with XRE-family HTH domain